MRQLHFFHPGLCSGASSLPHAGMLFIAGIFCISVFLSSPGLADAGGDLYAAGDYAGAVTWYEKQIITANGTEQAKLLNNLGAAYLALGQSDKALESYHGAVTADPSYGRGYVNLGVMNEKMQKPDDALKNYDSAATLDPGIRAEALVKKAALLASRGRNDEALKVYAEAEPLASGSLLAELLTGKGAVFFLQKKSDVAEQAFRAAIEADPGTCALAWTNLGVLLVSQGKYDDAKAAFDSAISLDPKGITGASQYREKLVAMINKSASNSTKGTV